MCYGLVVIICYRAEGAVVEREYKVTTLVFWNYLSKPPWKEGHTGHNAPRSTISRFVSAKLMRRLRSNNLFLFMNSNTAIASLELSQCLSNLRLAPHQHRKWAVFDHLWSTLYQYSVQLNWLSKPRYATSWSSSSSILVC